LSQDLAAIADRGRLLEAANRRIEDVFEMRAVILLPDENGRVAVPTDEPQAVAPDEHDRGVAQWAFDHEQPAGAGTPTLPASKGLYLPLVGARGPVGILGSLRAARWRTRRGCSRRSATRSRWRSSARGSLPRPAARCSSAGTPRETLLSPVSHPRTPLAVTGAGSSLLAGGPGLLDATRREPR
jgi:two-component system sensor histidine kinase KdpD